MTIEGENRQLHERLQETLAAYVLHALDEVDRAEAEALMAQHLPQCEECAAALRDLEATAGMLALAVGPVAVPQTLWRRIRRGIHRRRRPARRWAVVAVGAAALLVVAALAGWNFTLSGRMGRTEKREAASAEVLTVVSHPSSRVVPLAMRGAEPGTAPRLAVAFVPGESILSLFGTMPNLPQGRVYGLWLGAGDRYVAAAIFAPEGREVLLAIRADPYRYDSLVITVEPLGGSREPSSRRLAEASL